MQEYEQLKRLVAEIEADVDKAQGGNKEIKQAAQSVRNRVLEIRSVD